MRDSARSRTYGINHRIPAAPISQWKIRTIDQLPEHLLRLLETLPPYLTTKRAAELNGGGRSKLCDDASAGLIRAVKSDGSTLRETASILIRLANLPAAPISPTRAPKAPTGAAPAPAADSSVKGALQTPPESPAP